MEAAWSALSHIHPIWLPPSPACRICPARPQACMAGQSVRTAGPAARRQVRPTALPWDCPTPCASLHGLACGARGLEMQGPSARRGGLGLQCSLLRSSSRERQQPAPPAWRRRCLTAACYPCFSLFPAGPLRRGQRQRAGPEGGVHLARRPGGPAHQGGCACVWEEWGGETAAAAAPRSGMLLLAAVAAAGTVARLCNLPCAPSRGGPANTPPLAMPVTPSAPNPPALTHQLPSPHRPPRDPFPFLSPPPSPSCPFFHPPFPCRARCSTRCAARPRCCRSL